MKCKIEIEIDIPQFWKDDDGLSDSMIDTMICNKIINDIFRPAKANANVNCRPLEGEDRKMYEDRITLVDQAISTVQVKPQW